MKFNFDTIDETDLLEQTLKSRVELIGGTLEKVQLSGNHITPCIQVTVFFYLWGNKVLISSNITKQWGNKVQILGIIIIKCVTMYKFQVT